eukprot:1643399-Prymnesium_polylepis.1
MLVARIIAAGPCIEMKHSRTRCRDGVVEIVNLGAHHSIATDEGSQRDRCALAALPKQTTVRSLDLTLSPLQPRRRPERPSGDLSLWVAQTVIFPARTLNYSTL